MQVLTPSTLNSQIKSLLESTFLQVSVRGEVSNLTIHSSGFIFFSLKDSNSQVRCVIFKGNASKLRFQMQEGLNLIVRGSVSAYIPRGEYQINCLEVLPDGIGELSLAYQQLKTSLQARGYFDNKKPIPAFPKRVAVLTSITGAVIEDIKKVAQKRWNLAKFFVLNTLVQGEKAKESIATNIAYIDSFFGTPKGFDVIIIGRGGGSMEDLWAFNEEIVADAIYNARTPIISAVGHESDTVISDYVADMRAPTPSAAIEMLLPDRFEWLQRIDDISENLAQSFTQVFLTKVEQLGYLKEMLAHLSFEGAINAKHSQLTMLKEGINFAIQRALKDCEFALSPLPNALTQEITHRFECATNDIKQLCNAINARDPQRLGAFVQIEKDGEIRTLQSLVSGDEVQLIGISQSKGAKIL